jgi:hypothetical protein
MTTIAAAELTTFELAEDGSEIRMHMRDQSGAPASLVLPADCLQQLLLTVPQMVGKSLQARFGDETLRLVFSLAHWRIEQAHMPGTLILTLRTPDGFEVAFGLSGETPGALGAALASSAACAEACPLALN